MTVRIVDGDIFDQETEGIVNAWNRNIIPWWLLIPQGVSRAIKKNAGLDPFHELGRRGPIPLGGAVYTSGGWSRYRAIIHVASINMLWRASPRSIQDSVRSAVRLAERLQLRSLAFPILGSGSGGFDPRKAERLMCEALNEIESEIQVVLVRYQPP